MSIVSLLLSLLNFQGYMAIPKPWQVGFQPAASPMMEGITWMHNFLLGIITVIAIIVTCLLSYVIIRFREKRNPTPSKRSHNVLLEVVWTAVPTLIVLCIMVPSIKLIMTVDHVPQSDMTVKAIGHQWYWSYEYPEKNIAFDSYMIPDDKLLPGQNRLLEVDEPVVIPIDTTVKIMVTSQDVLHSFAVPSLGIKRDAVPGRINETWVRIAKPGVYYGQCSELCGIKHGFMPIAIKAVSKEDYQLWLEKKSKS